jgi:hypothetical protein
MTTSPLVLNIFERTLVRHAGAMRWLAGERSVQDFDWAKGLLKELLNNKQKVESEPIALYRQLLQ